MTNFFLRKLPHDSNANWLTTGLVAGGIVFFILFFLQPFGLGVYRGSVLAVALSFAALATVETLAFGWVVFKPWAAHVKSWRVWHECVAIMLLLCCISMGNFVLDMLWFHRPVSVSRFLAYLYETFLFGIPVTLAIAALNYQKRLRTQLDSMLRKDGAKQDLRTIVFHDAKARGNDLTIPMADFLYAEAQKNFVDIYFLNDGRVESRQLRATLASVLADADAESIFQCHRSFIVNLNRILSARGNSNGYRLTVGDSHHMVPVSRSYVKKLRSFVE